MKTPDPKSAMDRAWTLRRTLVAPLLVVASTASVPGDGALGAWCDLFRDEMAAAPGRAANASQIASRVATVATEMTRRRNGAGETLLPAAASVDSVALDAGTLEVRLTLPETLPGEEITPSGIETIQEILLAPHLASGQVGALRLLAQAGPTGDWRPLEAWTPQPAPVAYVDPATFDGTPLELPPAGPVPRNLPGQGSLGGGTSQPPGALSGRVIYTSGGHGWTWQNTQLEWYTQRGLTNGMVEDYGNQDALQFFAQYCFNAGATVVPLRPIGNQPNEVIVDNADPGFSIISGAWTTSTAGTPYYAAAPTANRYLFASISATETAVARFTPAIPQAGFYPVYTWVLDASNRTDQLYRINHSGGAATVRVDHRRVGRGWVWLGTYHFNAGTGGNVEISNQSTAGGTSVIADAIRFGNGIGDVDRGGGVSGYTREAEASRYWVQRAVGQGGNTGTYEPGSALDQDDNVGTPPRMAAEMNASTNYTDQAYLGFHTNAAGARGSVGLYSTSTTVTNQQPYAALMSNEIDNDCFVEDANWEFTWGNYGLTTLGGSYGEIGSALGGEMVGTIIEVAFHDDAQDAALLRDAKVRNVTGRACYQAMVRYFNTYGGGPLAFLPEPPTHLRVRSAAAGAVTLNWNAPVAGAPGGDAATGYRVYQSSNGLGFTQVATTAGTSVTINGLASNQVHFFRVAATNAGGESLPTETLAVRVHGTANPPVLIVNGFDRLDRTMNPTETASTNLGSHLGGGGTFERLFLNRMNTYNYIIAHAEAIHAFGRNFDSCTNESIIAGQVNLANHSTVVWILGEQARRDAADAFNTFSPAFTAAEQTAVANFLSGGGRLFLSGSDIGWDLDRPSGPSAADRTFYSTHLRADFATDSSGSHAANGETGSIFQGIALTFDDGSLIYNVNSADTISTAGAGTAAALRYQGGGLIHAFDALLGWQDPNFAGQTNADATSTFTIVSSPVRQGTGSGDLFYVWGSGNFIREYNSSQPQFPANSAFSIWVHGDASGNQVRFAFRDPVDTEIFVSPYVTVSWAGWQQITINSIANDLTWWAVGPTDNQFTGANAAFDSIQVNRVGGPASGHLYFDDARFTSAGGGGIAAVQSTGGTGRVVHLAFPFETITSVTARNQVMAAALTFFGTPVPAELSLFEAP